MSISYGGVIWEEITVDVSQPNEFAPRLVKQKDAYTRGYIITLTNNGEKLTIPTADTTAWFNCHNTTDPTKRASAAGTINSDGTVSALVPAVVMDVAGLIQCDVSIISTSGGNTHILKSTLFYLNCEEAANPSGTSSTAEDSILVRIASGEIAIPGRDGMLPLGVLSDNSDLNETKDEGHYILVTSYTYSNSPLSSGNGGTLEVFKTNNNIILQRITSLNNILYFRTSSGGSFAGKNWVSMDFSVPQYKTYGTLDTNTDLNDVKDEGHYYISNSNTYTNSPLASNKAGTLEVLKTLNSIVLQRVTSLDNAIYFRTSVGGSFSNRPWVVLDPAILFMGKGTLATGTDLNDVKTEGHYLLRATNIYSHSPFESNTLAMMEVFKTDGFYVQKITGFDGSAYYRSSHVGSFSDRSWSEYSSSGGGDTYVNNYTTQHYENTYNITSSPTITTDTNNFLAASGTTADRAADIQAMLQTGYCKLGPGAFYVSGIEVNGTLEGCGARTQIILLDNAQNTYAVKLLSNSCVKNVRIQGQNSVYTVSSTVGNRHGILFEGTSDASQNPQTYKRAMIENCYISDFNGGGITGYNTGGGASNNLLVNDCHIYRCDAGINLPYISEFHRFTNVSVTNCYYGCINNGGNNNFTNCNFSGNTLGLLMDNSNNQSPNNGHGTFSCCTFNHSGNNQGLAIKMIGITPGEIFTGSQIFYGGIYIDSCSGIRFSCANIGNSTPITVTNSSAVIFSDCIFNKSNQSPITESGNTCFKFENCYNRDGTEFPNT